LFLVLDRLFLKKLLDKSGTIAATLFTFLVATLGWVVFRIEDMADAMQFYQRLFAFDFAPLSLFYNREFMITLIAAILFSFITMTSFGRIWEDRVYFRDYSPRQFVWIGAFTIILFTLSVASITASGFNPFIYFRF
jgi:alginate O-acetyltransferase complex protein AlgI